MIDAIKLILIEPFPKLSLNDDNGHVKDDNLKGMGDGERWRDALCDFDTVLKSVSWDIKSVLPPGSPPGAPGQLVVWLVSVVGMVVGTVKEKYKTNYFLQKLWTMRNTGYRYKAHK